MTIDEFQRDWRECGLVSTDGNNIYRLTDMFRLCWKKKEEALLFDAGGRRGPNLSLLKLNRTNHCFEKKDLDLPDGEGWEWIGTVVLL